MGRFRVCVAAWLLLCADPLLADSITIASFNIRIYSNNSRTDAELEQIADRLQLFDLIAVQEVNDREVVDRTLAILSVRGLPYSAIVSEEVGRSSADERYAFFWRTDVVNHLGTLGFWPDTEDVFIREPFAATFQAGSFDFTLVTIHSIFGDTIGERRTEAGWLDEVYAWAREADPAEQDVILLGDFNLPPEDHGFDDLRSLLFPVFSGEDQTTIADNHLDNIWIDQQQTIEWTGEVGIDRFDETVFGGDDDAASLAVSNHRPIWAVFNIDGLDDDGPGGPTAIELSSWAAIKRHQSGDFLLDFWVPKK